ncbi:citrate lyase holo-[acyl-carrier protein] synthase [Ignavigranum ruoffiae]|uniref:citrate lyase holo-[acyl-carrier protein] synthase n=1 Tax=Ignavigranum ruoffiae TaxID=89093 RepID=UPI0024ACC238|nr:citrate lyase holo-[acyl-carrier protein] synthase [Ignavigranum ruoffiae]
MYREKIFNGREIELFEMLEAREARVAKQNELLNQFPEASLLSFTLNIPGPVKNSSVLKKIFDQICQDIEETNQDLHCLSKEIYHYDTGNQAFYLWQTDPAKLKKRMINYEDSADYGRLCDLDILYKDHHHIKSLSRSDLDYPMRKCFICGLDAKICSRSRAHSVSRLQVKIEELIHAKGV